MAPVGFMFQRRGIVTVGMDKGDDFEDRLDAVAEMALLNGAVDFEELPTESESQSQVKVCCYARSYYFI